MGKIIGKKIRGMSGRAKASLVLTLTLLITVFMYQGWLRPIITNSAVNQKYYFTLDTTAQSIGADGTTSTALANNGTGKYSLGVTAYTGSTSYAAVTPTSAKTTVGTLYSPVYASNQVLTNPYLNVAVRGGSTGNITWYADIYDYDPAGAAGNGTLLWSTTGTDTYSGTTTTNRVLTFSSPAQQTIASGHRLKAVISANSASVQARLYFYTNAATYSYLRVDETNPNTDSIGNLADYNNGGLTSVIQGENNVAMLKFQMQSNMAGGDTWSGGKLDKIGSNANLGDIKCNIYYDANNDGVFDPAVDQRITNDIVFTQATGMAYTLSVPQTITSTPKRYFVVMSVASSAATTSTVGLRIVDTTYFSMATGPLNPITSTSSSQPQISSTGAAVTKTYMADWDTGTTLFQPDTTAGLSATNSTCPTAARIIDAAGTRLVGLLNFPAHTCTSTTSYYHQSGEARADYVTLYFNGPQGYAQNMTTVAGQSFTAKLSGSTISTSNPVTYTATLFYINPVTGTRVLSPASTSVTITATSTSIFDLSTSGQTFTNVPAGARLGIQIGVSRSGARVYLGSATASQLVVNEAAASTNGVDVNNGSVAAKNASVAAGTTGAVADTFNMVSPGGPVTVTGVTITGNSTTNSTNVQTVRIYRDNGPTPGVLDTGVGGDTLIGSGTFSGNTATITFTTGENVGTSLQEYLIAYDITAAPVVGQTLTGTVTAISGATTDVINNFTSATLTITPTTYVTNGAGEPANSVVGNGGAAQFLDSFGLKVDGGSNDTINSVTATLLPTGISAKVAMVEIVDRSTGTVYGSLTAPTAVDDWRVSTPTLPATTGTTECYIRITPRSNITATYAITGTVSSVSHTSNNVVVMGDTGSATVTFDGQAPTDPVLTAASGASIGSVQLNWTASSDASGLNATGAYKVVRGAANSPAPNDCSTGTVAYQGNALTFTDTGLTAGATYAYRACAIDVVNNTSPGTTGQAMATLANNCTTTPSVVVTPPSQYVRDGAQAQYTINVTNNDTGSCGATTFNLSIVGTENSTDFATPSTFSPASVSLAANGGGANVILYVTAKSTAAANATDTFQVQVAGASHPTVTAPAVVTTVNPFGPMLHTSVNVGTKYGTWGTNFTCATCHSYNGTTNVKRIATTVQTPQGPRSVTFSTTSSVSTVYSGVFGNDLRPSTTSSTNICEVCHHQTTQHQYSSMKNLNNAHHNSNDCMKCHPHGKGFKYSGGAGCTDCHGYPPTSAATMASPPTNAFGLNPPDYGAHATHVNKASLTCSACHNNYTQNPMGNNLIEMGFAINGTNFPGFVGTINSGTFIGNSNINTFYRWTSNSPGTTIQKQLNTTKCGVYCHGWPGSNGMNTNPWFVGSNQATCGACHGATGANPPSSGSHTKHASTATGNNGIVCTKCHGTYANYSTPPTHINGNVEWNLSAVSSLAKYKGVNSGGTGAPAPSSPATYGSCSTLYCHSNVQGVNGVGGPTAYGTPTWGSSATVHCGTCHVNMYTDPAATGGHVQHAQDPNTGFDCRICHGNGGDANPQNHANGFIDLNFQGYGANTIYTISGGPKTQVTPGSGYGTCSSTNCHGRQTKTWGPSTATPLCNKCHGQADASGFYSTLGPGSTTSVTDPTVGSVIGYHTQHLTANPRPYAARFDCSECHLKPAGPYDPGHIDTPLPAELTFGTLANSATFKGYSGIASASYNFTSKQCSNVWCHGYGMDSNVGKGNYASVVTDGGTLGSPVTPTWNVSILTGTASNDCTKCHNYPPPAPTAGYTHFGKTPTDCNGCHNHVNTNGTGFVNYTAQTLHVNGTVNGGCTTCHGNPPTVATLGGPNGLVTPAINALSPANAGAHAAHVGNPNIGNVCSTCHKGYTTQMPSHTMEMGFSAFGGKVTGGTFTGYSTLTNDVYVSSSAGTIVRRTNNTTIQNTCSVYCHGAGQGVLAPIGGGTLTSPDWELGAAEAACGTCHGVSTTSAPIGGSHSKHALSTGLGLSCDTCHGTITGNNHVDGSVAWHLKVSDARLGATATYGGYSSHATGALAPSTTYGNCNNLYCHSNVQGAGGTGVPTAYAAPQWGNSATAACGTCHLNMATDPVGTGSHYKHANLHGYACATCHNGAGSGTTNHANHGIDIAFSSGAVGTTYSLTSPVPPGTAYGSCSNATCHSLSGVFTAAPIQWGAASSCTNCHGGNAQSAAPITLGKHAKHTNNAAFLGTNFGCIECHARTVSNDTTISVAANHGNGFIDYSGVKAGKNSSYTSSTGVCSATYCHSDGKGKQNVAFSSSNGWNSAATLNCLGCHGNDNAAGSFTSQFGEPNYSNAGANLARSNSHRTTNNKHVTAASDCGNCHNSTTTNGTSLLAGGAHLDKAITLLAGNSKSFTWTSGTKTCSNISCHSLSGAFTGNNVQWGATYSCTLCHGNNATSGAPITLGKHAKHTNNAAFLGTNFGCIECHAKTVSSDTTIGTPANHQNGFVDFSGARAGKSTSYSTSTGVCSSTYCHTDGKGLQKMVAANNWNSAATLDCKGCHGSDPNAGSFTSQFGEPNYSNAGSGQPRANSHRTTNNQHVTAATSCGNCHAQTTSTGTSITGTAHLNATINPVAGNGKAFTYTAGTKTCSNISCHALTGVFTSNNVQWGTPASCVICHGGDANSATPMTLGKHAKHTNNAGFLGTNFGCVDCHAKTVSNNTTIGNANNHMNGFIDFSGARTGKSTTYSSTTGVCSATYCHTDGKGKQNVAFTTANGWQSTATLDCKGCHGNDNAAGSFSSSFGEPNYSNAGSGQTRANSHRTTNNRHVTAATDCGNCHGTTTTNGTSIIASSSHLDTSITLSAGNSKSFTYTAATKTCSNISCHALTGVFTSNNVQWGTPGSCTICHGNNATSGSPITLGKHAAHTNNAAVIGTNFSCIECHAKTVSNDTTIGNANNHMNGFVDFSGARASKSYTSTTGVCSATYCHTDGKGTQKMTAANNWKSAATLNCTGCHGSDQSAGSFTSQYGEPNYSNAGANVLRSNSHQTHVADFGAATACGNCHAATSTNGTSITGTAHLSQTINPVAGNGRTFSWNGGTKTCTTSNCHGQGAPQWGATLWSSTNQCEKCHGSANMANFYSTAYPTQVTSPTDTKVGAHAFHLYSTNNKYSGAITCTACHTTPTPATILSGNHLNGVNNVDFPTGSAARFNSTFPQYSSATGRCSTTYCHGSKMPDGSNNGSNTRPVWNNTAYLTGTPSVTECGTCHGFPPNTGTHTGVLQQFSACNGCHTQVNTDGTFNNKWLHINGVVDASGGGCNGCHDYDTVAATYAGGVWTGGTWGKNSKDGLNPNEGWGAHAKHINYIKTRLAIGAAGLTPTGQTFGTGEPANVCGTCHTNNVANHSTGGSTVRTINFGDGTFKMGGATGTSILFGSTNPLYNGVSGVSSATTPKTCSNISCHYFTTPLWSTY
jgi:predicted CxxxxCH...CXXCH cytochrome family protein